MTKLISQLKRGSYFYSAVLQKKVIFIGFINSRNEDLKYLSKLKKLEDIKFIIYGINKSFCGKNMTTSIDWDLARQFNELNGKFNELNGKVNKLISKFRKKGLYSSKKNQKPGKPKEKKEKAFIIKKRKRGKSEPPRISDNDK